MTRGTAINVLIGATLILVCALPFIALAIFLHGLDLAVTRYFPALKNQADLLLPVVFILSVLIIGARQLRKRLWTNAFLSLTAALVMTLPWLLGSQPLSSGAPVPGAWFVAVFLVSGFMRTPSRAEFIGASTLIALSFAAQTGLLGSGYLSGFVQTGIVVAVGAWLLVLARKPEWMFTGSIPSLASNRPTTGSPS